MDMRRGSFWFVSFWASVYAISEPLPIDVFTSPPEIGSVQLSPDGKYLAITKREGQRSRFTVFTYPERKPTAINFPLGEDREIAGFMWKTDDSLLVTPARRIAGANFSFPTGELMRVDVSTGQVEPLQAGFLLHSLPDDPDHILTTGSFDRFNVAYKLNIRNGRRQQIARGAAPRGSFTVNAAGEIAFSIGTNSENETEVHVRKKSKWELVHRHGYSRMGWTPIGPGPGENSHFTRDSRGASTGGLGLYDALADEHQLIFRHPVVDLGSLVWDFGQKQAWGIRSNHHYPKLHYLNTSHPLARQHASLSKVYPEANIRFTSSTRDHNQSIALVSSDRRPGDFVFLDAKARKIEPLMSSRPDIRPEAMATMDPIELQVRDGSTVYGYMTSLPDTPKPGPTIVVVHGGPHGIRDYWGYNGEIQLLANRGFHVLQINYRGSGGYGLNYQRAGFGEWGGLIQDDITDSTQWAIETKIADPARICIYGASFGAYSAMMGAVKEPALYRCAVGISGMYDATIMEKAGDLRTQRAAVDYLREVLGNDRDALESISPVHLADKIEAAVMLVHGGQDPRTPPEHAHRMRKALAESGKDVEWFFDSDQGHGIQGREDRIIVYEKILAFLETQIGD